MSEWPEILLGELGAPSRSAFATGPFGSAIASKFFTAHGVPVIRGSNLSADVGTRLIADEFAYVSEETSTPNVGLLPALAGFDELIEINERSIELLEDLARSTSRSTIGR